MVLLLDYPTKWVRGKYSGVDLTNSSQNKAVICVHDVALDSKLHCHVGIIDHTSSRTAWGDMKYYDTGQYPSVALITMGDKLYAVEVHLSDYRSDCYYNVFEVNTRDKSIQSGSSCYFCRGKNPKVAANDKGTVIVVKEKPYSVADYLQLFIGKFDPNTKRIDWKFQDLVVPGFCGVQPDVAINLNKIVIACRSDGKIRFRIGSINDDLTIKWGTTSELQAEGDNSTSGRSPSIALNSNGTIVETHQSWALRKLGYCYGRVIEDSILWVENKTHDTGEYPCISLSDDGTIVEVHKTNLGSNLFWRMGEVRNQVAT